MAKKLSILRTGHCSNPERRAARPWNIGVRYMHKLRDEEFMISRCENLSPTDS